jgi:hypothetical protein
MEPKRRGRVASPAASVATKSGRKDKVFILATENYPVLHKIKSSNITIYDEDSDSVRAIRYCPEEKSIFVEDQNEKTAKRAAIWFEDGKILVPKTQPNLQDFLDSHPDNVSNGGNIFKELNLEVDASKVLEMEDMIFEAQALLRDKAKSESGIQELLGIAKIHAINTNRSFAEVKFDLIRLAKSNPSEFISSFDNPTIRVRYIAILAKEVGIIDTTNELYVKWSHNGNTICNVPVGEDHFKILGSFMLEDRGLGVREQIEKQLAEMGLI